MNEWIRRQSWYYTWQSLNLIYNGWVRVVEGRARGFGDESPPSEVQGRRSGGRNPPEADAKCENTQNIIFETLKDWTNVHNNIRMVYPCRRSLIRRAARNSRRKPRLMKLSCTQDTASYSTHIQNKGTKVTLYIYSRLIKHECQPVSCNRKRIGIQKFDNKAYM